MQPRPPISTRTATPFPYTTLFRSGSGRLSHAAVMGRLCRSRATGLQSPQVTIPDAGHNATSRSRRELQPALHGAVAQADQRNFMLIEIAIGIGLEIGEAVSAAKIGRAHV